MKRTRRGTQVAAVLVALCMLSLRPAPLRVRQASPVEALAGSAVGLHVVDSSSMVGSETRRAVEDVLSELLQETSKDVLLVMLPSLDGREISSVASQWFEEWAGQSDDKLLVLVAMEQRQAWIKHSANLEGLIQDPEVARDVRTSLQNGFRSGDPSELALETCVSLSASIARASGATLRSLGIRTARSKPVQRIADGEAPVSGAGWLLAAVLLGLATLGAALAMQRGWLVSLTLETLFPRVFRSWSKTVGRAEAGVYDKWTEGGELRFRIATSALILGRTGAVLMLFAAGFWLVVAVLVWRARPLVALLLLGGVVGLAARGVKALRPRHREVVVNRGTDRLEGNGELICHLGDIDHVTVSKTWKRRQGFVHQVLVVLRNGKRFEVFEEHREYPVAAGLAISLGRHVGVPFRGLANQDDDEPEILTLDLSVGDASGVELDSDQD